MRLPGAEGASTAKGLRCQCQASRTDMSSILVHLQRSLSHTSSERSWRLSLVSQMGFWVIYFNRIHIVDVSDYLCYCRRHFSNAFWSLCLLLDAVDHAGYPCWTVQWATFVGQEIQLFGFLSRPSIFPLIKNESKMSSTDTLLGVLHPISPPLVAFEHRHHSQPQASNIIIFLGGLCDGLLTVPYGRYIASSLPSSWALMEPILSCSYRQFGISSLSKDVAEIAQLVEYVHKIHPHGKIVLFGHSTGSQQVMHYCTLCILSNHFLF